MCLYPTLRKNRKYTSNKKNGGIIPPLPLVYDKENDRIITDKRVLLVPTGCGKCIECMKQKAREWSVRLQEDIRHNKNGKFITLTFSNESIKKINADINKLTGYERDNEIATKAVRRFTERWRKEYKTTIRHWLVTELGGNGTENIHMHGIVWTNETNEKISKHWQYGGITIGKRLYINGKAQNTNTTGYVGEQSINYITKYINKIDKIHKEYKPKILCSKGIGKGYLERTDSKLNTYKGTNTKETYTTRQGKKLALPIYYRNKIYTDEERQELWLDKLDKQERWIGGEKVDISKGDDKYYQLLEYYREQNTKLGYGDNKINWDRRSYENERRNINFMKRINDKNAT